MALGKLDHEKGDRALVAALKRAKSPSGIDASSLE
jgi:hypothetical protein